MSSLHSVAAQDIIRQSITMFSGARHPESDFEQTRRSTKPFSAAHVLRDIDHPLSASLLVARFAQLHEERWRQHDSRRFITAGLSLTMRRSCLCIISPSIAISWKKIRVALHRSSICEAALLEQHVRMASLNPLETACSRSTDAFVGIRSVVRPSGSVEACKQEQEFTQSGCLFERSRRFVSLQHLQCCAARRACRSVCPQSFRKGRSNDANVGEYSADRTGGSLKSRDRES